jgi:sugar phosphate isomerase/epimerase
MTALSSRRDFLKSAACLPLALSAGATLGGVTSVSAAVEAPKRVGGANLKLSLNAYSFAKMLNDRMLNRGPGISLLELAEFCAKHNFDAMDPTAYYFPGYRERKVPPDSFLFDVKKRCFELGIEISGTGTGNNFTVADWEARARDVDWVKKTVEMAAKIGAPVVRVFADTQMRAQTWETVSNGATRDEVEKWMADDIRACTEHGEKFGVIIGIQNHGDFLKTADNLISLIKRVDSRWCGAIVDTGYFKAEDPYAEIEKAAPYAVNWQVKQSPMGVEKEAEAPTDLKRLFTIVRKSGYRGYLPIETLSPRGGGNYDPFVVVPKFLAEVRAALAATA